MKRLFAVVLAGILIVASRAHGEEPRNFVVDRDIAYLAPDRPEKLDLYLPPDPKDQQKRPAVIVIHGGGWTSGDKADDREVEMAGTLANAGYVVISINYKLATREGPAWPGCLDDCRAAVRWLREHANEYAIDPARVGAIGGSVGGTLSLRIGNEDAVSGFKPVQTIVALYAPSNIAVPRFDSSFIFGHSRDARPDIYRDASPIAQVGPGFPPTLLIHGTADSTVPHEQSQKLAERLTEFKVANRIILLKDTRHTFKLHDPINDLRQTVVEFFDTHLKKQK